LSSDIKIDAFFKSKIFINYKDETQVPSLSILPNNIKYTLNQNVHIEMSLQFFTNQKCEGLHIKELIKKKLNGLLLELDTFSDSFLDESRYAGSIRFLGNISKNISNNTFDSTQHYDAFFKII
jgi:hypothetical protein